MSSARRQAISKVAAVSVVAAIVVIASLGGAFYIASSASQSTATVTSTMTVSGTGQSQGTSTVTTTVTVTGSASGLPSTVKVGIICNSGLSTPWCQVNKAGFEKALAIISKGTGIKFDVSATWTVSDADAQSTITNFASNGNKFVAVLNGAWQDQVLQVGKQYPNTDFLAAIIGTTGPNVETFYLTGFEQGYYVLGVMAGSVTKSNTVGFVSSFNCCQIGNIANAFLAGAKSVNPKVKMLTALTGDWSDPVKGASAVDALVAAGADVVAPYGDGLTIGAINEAAQKGIYSFGNIGDMSNVAPKSVLASVTWNITQIYESSIEGALSGTFGYHYWRYDAGYGTIGLAINPALNGTVISSQVSHQASQAMLQIITGQLTVPENSTFPKS